MKRHFVISSLFMAALVVTMVWGTGKCRAEKELRSILTTAGEKGFVVLIHGPLPDVLRDRIERPGYGSDGAVQGLKVRGIRYGDSRVYMVEPSAPACLPQVRGDYDYTGDLHGPI